VAGHVAVPATPKRVVPLQIVEASTVLASPETSTAGLQPIFEILPILQILKDKKIPEKLKPYEFKNE
jgi:hypothetical protein